MKSKFSTLLMVATTFVFLSFGCFVYRSAFQDCLDVFSGRRDLDWILSKAQTLLIVSAVQLGISLLIVGFVRTMEDWKQITSMRRSYLLGIVPLSMIIIWLSGYLLSFAQSHLVFLVVLPTILLSMLIWIFFGRPGPEKLLRIGIFCIFLSVYVPTLIAIQSEVAYIDREAARIARINSDPATNRFGAPSIVLQFGDPNAGLVVTARSALDSGLKSLPFELNYYANWISLVVGVYLYVTGLSRTAKDAAKAGRNRFLVVCIWLLLPALFLGLLMLPLAVLAGASIGKFVLVALMVGLLVCWLRTKGPLRLAISGVFWMALPEFVLLCLAPCR